MALPTSVVQGAKGKYGAAYYAGVANVLGNYSQQRQSLNAQQGQVAIQSIGAITQTVMAGFDSYRQYSLEREKVQYDRDRALVADQQWRMGYERQLRQDEIANAHSALENEKSTMELVKLRRAAALEAPTMAAKMSAAAGLQDIQSRLGQLRSDGVINTEEVQNARASLAGLRDSLRAQSAKYPDMNLSEEYAELAKADAAITEFSSVTIGDQKVSIASIPGFLDVAPSGEDDVRDLYDISRNRELPQDIRDSASARLRTLMSEGNDPSWAAYNSLDPKVKEELSDYANLITDSTKRRLVQTNVDRGDTRPVHEMLKPGSSNISAPANTLSQGAKKELIKFNQPVSYHSNNWWSRSGKLTVDELATATAEAGAEVSAEEMFGPGEVGQKARAAGNAGLVKWAHDVDALAIQERVTLFANRQIAQASFVTNPAEQKAALLDLQTFLQNSRLREQSMGKDASPSAVPFTFLFATRSSPASLGLTSLAASPNAEVASLAANLLATYSSVATVAPGQLSAQEAMGNLRPIPPPSVAPVIPGVQRAAALPGMR